MRNTLSREVEGQGPMKPGNRPLSIGANSFGVEYTSEDEEQYITSSSRGFYFTLNQYWQFL
jgi:hypothetical protein